MEPKSRKVPKRRAIVNSIFRVTVSLVIVIELIIYGPSQYLFAQEGIEATHENIERQASILTETMVEAHGGYEQWHKTPSITFINEFYDFKSFSNLNEDAADLYKYKVSIKPENSLGYADFIMQKGDNRILYDGTDIITIGHDGGDHNLDKASALLLFYEYALINLPWLTKAEGVRLKYSGKGKLPLETVEYQIVTMTFEHFDNANIHEGYFKLYLNPRNGLLKGIKQTATFPKLPGTKFSFGMPSLQVPLVHIIKGYVRKNGLIVPDSFVTFQNGKLLGIRFFQYSDFEEQLDSKQILTTSTEKH